MGQFRASIKDIVGVKFDRKLTIRRMSDMGVIDQDVIKKVVDEMEAAHSRATFLKLITVKSKVK